MFKNLPPQVLDFYENKSSEHATFRIKRPWFGDTATLHFATASTQRAINNLRGRTFHHVVFDEMAFCPSNAWPQVFEPMLDEMQGKAILTSTINGPNHFHQLGEHARSEWQKRNPTWGHLEMDVHSILKDEPGLRPPGWWEEKVKTAKAVGKYHILRQEYEHDRYAGVPRKYPLAESLTDCGASNLVPMPAFDPAETTIFITCDIGKPGNYGTWGYIIDHFSWRPTFIHYSDEHGSIEKFIHNMYEKFHMYGKIQIRFPHDIKQANLGQGGDWLQLARRVVLSRRKFQKIKLRWLSKTTSARDDWHFTQQQLPRFDFVLESDNVGVGYEKLKTFQFRTDPNTGEVLWGKYVLNGSQHAADAMRYAIIGAERPHKLNDVAMDTFRLDNTTNIGYNKDKPLLYTDTVASNNYVKGPLLWQRKTRK